MPAVLCSFQQLFQQGDTRAPLRASAYAALTNIVLDPLFIFGAPYGCGLGVAGAAAATVLAQVFLHAPPWFRSYTTLFSCIHPPGF